MDICEMWLEIQMQLTSSSAFITGNIIGTGVSSSCTTFILMTDLKNNISHHMDQAQLSVHW
jgi:hypothetical protein